MNVLRRLGAAAAAALCALAVAVAAAATGAHPDAAQVLGATSEANPLAIPHGAAREDVSVVAPDPAIVSGKRWAAEVHRIAEPTAAPAGGVDGGSFDWQDAGAGALAALGLVALLAVGAYGLRSRAWGRPASDPAS